MNGQPFDSATVSVFETAKSYFRAIAMFMAVFLFAWMSNAQTVNVTYAFTNFLSNPAQVQGIEIDPLCAGPYNTAILVPETIITNRANYPPLVTNPVINVNLQVGFGYAVRFNEGWKVLSFTNYFGTNLAGAFVNGANYNAFNLSWPCPFTPAYLNPVVSNLTYQITVNGFTNAVGTNAAYWVGPNASIVVIGTNYDTLYAASNALSVATNSFDSNGAAIFQISLWTNGFQGQSNALQAQITAAGQTNLLQSNIWLNTKQPANANLTNWSTVGTNQYETVASASTSFDALGAATASFQSGSNFTLATGGNVSNNIVGTSNLLQGQIAGNLALLTAISNFLLNTKQPASQNLTNWSTVGTNQYETVSSAVGAFDPLGTATTAFTTASNFSLTIGGNVSNNIVGTSNILQNTITANQTYSANASNALWFDRQPANANLTNWSTVGTNQYQTVSSAVASYDAIGQGIAAFQGGSNFTLVTGGNLSNNVVGTSNILQGQITSNNGFAVSVSNALLLAKQPASLNLTNWSTVGTNQYETVTAAVAAFDPLGTALSTFLTGSNFALTVGGNVSNNVAGTSNLLQGQITANQTYSANASNALQYAKQPASGNLTNWATVGTNQYETVSSANASFDVLGAATTAFTTAFTTASNFALTVGLGASNNVVGTSNILQGGISGNLNFAIGASNFLNNSKQPGSPNLTNWATVQTNQYLTGANATNTFQMIQAAALVATAISNYAAALATANTNNTTFTSNVLALANNTTSNGLQGAIVGITNGLFFVTATNGTATGLEVESALVLNETTNFSSVNPTNVIGVVGNNGGTYVGGPFSVIWTNQRNNNLTILLSGSSYFLQTNSAINPTLYSFGSNLGNGTVVSGAAPAPTASFGGRINFNGFVVDGYITSTDLTAQIQAVGAIPVVAAYGLTNGIVTGTNYIGINTNTIIQLIALNSIGPTNGIGTNAFYILLNQWITTNQVAVTNVTAPGGQTNILGTGPNGNEVWFTWSQLPSGGGGSTPNAYITNSNPNAMPGFTNLAIGLGVQTLNAGTIGVTNIVSPGQPGIWIGDPYGSSGLKANIGLNAAQSDFSAPNLDSIIMAGGQDTNYAHQAVSIGSLITNNFSSTFVYNSSGVFVGPSTLNEALFFPGNGFGIDTNNPAGFALNVFGNANFSGLFIGGVAVQTNSGIPLLNGVGTNTTLNMAVSVVTTNLAVINAAYLNASNLNATFIQTNSLQGGYFPWGLVPAMNWSNTPSGLVWGSGNFSNAGAQQTNLWGVFTTNAVFPSQVSWNTGQSNIVQYSFPVPVIASGQFIQFAASGAGDQIQILFQDSTDNVNWTSLNQLNEAPALSPGQNAWTNFFSPVFAQYYRWAITNGNGSGGGTFAVVGVGAQPEANIFGPNQQFIANGNSVNNTLEANGATLFIDATNGSTVNGGLSVASQLTAPTASFGDESVGGNINAQSYTLNGIPLNFGAVSNATVNSYTVSGLVNFNNGTLYPETNLDGTYVPSGIGYFTNATTGYGAMIPYTYTNIIQRLYSQIWQAYNGGPLPPPFQSYYSQFNIIVTNINTIGFGANSNLTGAFPLFARPGNLVGQWGSTYVNSPFGNPTVSVLTYTIPTSANVIVTSSNGVATVPAYTNNGAITYDIQHISVSAQGIYFIANQSSTLPIATRPAICYTQLGGWFVKTNAATDNSGWMQIGIDSGH